jgi:hypothetical protein
MPSPETPRVSHRKDRINANTLEGAITNTRSLRPTARAEENARSVDGLRDDDSFLDLDSRCWREFLVHATILAVVVGADDKSLHAK